MFEDTKKIKALASFFVGFFFFFKLQNTIFQMVLIESREFVGFQCLSNP